MNDKKRIILTVIGIVFILILIFGATYAYFSVEVTNDNGVTNVDVDADEIGSVALTNPTPNLHLSLSSKDMSLDNVGEYYATNDSNKYFDEEKIQREILGINLIGGNSSDVYECNATLNINLEGTAVNAFQKGDAYIQFGGLLSDKVDLTEIPSDGYDISAYLVPEQSATRKITASIALVNKVGDQSYLAGKSLSVNITNSDFNCTLTEMGNNTITSSNSGTLAISGAVGTELNNYKIYGNSIQNGTPSPTNPVEVESVGDRTNNLFDFANLILKGNATTTKNSVTLPDNSTTYTTQEMLINADSNTTYTLYGIIETKNSSGHIAIDCLDENKTTIKTNIIVYNAEDNKKFKTITTPANTKYLRVNLRNRTTDGFTMKDIMIAKGSVSHFEPIGYKIPIISKGKNLLDYKWFLQEGNEWISGSYHRRYIQLKPNTTYTIKSYIPEDADPKPGLFVANYVEAYDVPQANGHWATTTGTREATFTTDSTGLIIIKRIINWQVTDQTIIDFFNTPGVEIQLEEGSVATEYEPYVEPITTNIYLDEPLRKVGTTSDYIDFANKNVVRNINVLNINDYNTVALFLREQTIST